MRTPQEIAEIVISLLKERRIAVKTMLRECGLDDRVVSNMKSGSMPSADKLALIARYLNLKTDTLLGMTPNDEPGAPGSAAVSAGLRAFFGDGDRDGVTENGRITPEFQEKTGIPMKRLKGFRDGQGYPTYDEFRSMLKAAGTDAPECRALLNELYDRGVFSENPEDKLDRLISMFKQNKSGMEAGEYNERKAAI